MPESGDKVDIVLATTLGTDQWDLPLPTRVIVQAIIAKLVSSPELPFQERDPSGTPIPYRLMWKEGERHLLESETLGAAGVGDGHTLIMTQEARAGRPASDLAA